LTFIVDFVTPTLPLSSRRFLVVRVERTYFLKTPI